jgi:hypothetical protein
LAPASTQARLRSDLEAEGAEFLVLGLLLVERIQAMKAYTNFPGYDLVAFNPEANLSCRIQVKSRWATDYDKSFPLKNTDTDFVVHAALNRGYRYRRKAKPEDDGRRPPEIYVFPVEIAEAAARNSGAWGDKVYLRSIPDAVQYVDKWDLIRDFLRLERQP